MIDKKHSFKKERFTLIEMLIGIVILGILASIVIPSIKDFQKDAIISSVHSNIRILQTAVDTYSLKNDSTYPSAIQPTLENPQLIDIESLYPDYIKSKPDYDRVKGQKYWVDYQGKVWGATVDSPANIFMSDQYLEWSSQENVEAYNVYQLNGSGVESAVNPEKISLKQSISLGKQIDKIRLEKPNYQFLISSVDRYGLETVPVGLNQLSVQDGFTPMFKKAGTYYFELKGEEVMFWDSFRSIEVKPEGTSITYQFAIKGENGEYGDYQDDFNALDPSKGIKVKIVMKGANGVNPSLYNLHIFYHLASDEVIETFTTTYKNMTQDGTIIRQDLPVELTDEFTLPAGMRVKDIISTDSYSSFSAPPKTVYQYRPKGSDQFIPIYSIIDVPEQSTIRVTRTYEEGEEVAYSQPFVSLKEDMKVVSVTQSGEKETFNTKLPPSEWTTVDTLNFFAHSGDGQKVHWVKANITANVPKDTQIIYTYSTANDSSWSKEVDDILKVSDSRSIRVTAKLQVKTSLIGKVEEPSVTSVSIESEKGVTNLSMVAPTVSIFAKKSNNQFTNTFSIDTQIEWMTETSDPRGKKIINTEWSGDKRTQYPVGTYEVKARVQNESGYWSQWTSFRFEVKPEKPTAVLEYSPTIVEVNKTVNWKYENSTDPDGDAIVQAEWSGDKQSNYSQPGNYTVRLRVQDADGNWSDWVEKTITVYLPSIDLATIKSEDKRYTTYNYATVVSNDTASDGQALHLTWWTNGTGGYTHGEYSYNMTGNGFDITILKAYKGELYVNGVLKQYLNNTTPQTISVRNLPNTTNTIRIRVPYASANYATIDNIEVYGYAGSQDFFDIRTYQLDSNNVQSVALNNKVVGSLSYKTKTYFSIRNHGTVTAVAKNSSGETVKTFFTNKTTSGGSEISSITWDGKGDNGERVPTGMYSIVLTANNEFGNTISSQVAIDVNNEMPSMRVEAEDPIKVKLANGIGSGPKADSTASGGSILFLRGWYNGYGGYGYGTGTMTFNGTGLDVKMMSGTKMAILVDNVVVTTLTSSSPVIYPIRGLTPGNHTLVLRMYGSDSANIDYIDVYQ